jgi:DNA-binding HxlR family transcriptional regulator
MEVLGGKWKLLVVASLAKEPMRFSEIRRSIPEISEKMLARTLKDLEVHQIVLREAKAGNPPQVCYSLSEYGHGVLPLLRALFEWGEGHIQRFRELIFF